MTPALEPESAGQGRSSDSESWKGRAISLSAVRHAQGELSSTPSDWNFVGSLGEVPVLVE